MSFEETPGTAGNNPLPEPERRDVTVRRAPRYVPFLILGGIVGVAVAAVVAFALPGSASYDPGSVFGFFMILFAAGGALLGAAAALVLDRLSVRRAEHAVVESVPDTDTGTENISDTGTDGHPSPQS
ncbi:hypothetical protein [Arthrobacter rhizosphaerae]|uniref:hypothetical protein n=1 Tax=Arthrobacter rhizosphaerae TaxID=2855490 RepID=UPI001FF63AC2|nr:hypothetical protein [Arthrobacter rhizosphaerae]